jgi:hypothetical protein
MISRMKLWHACKCFRQFLSGHNIKALCVLSDSIKQIVWGKGGYSGLSIVMKKVDYDEEKEYGDSNNDNTREQKEDVD